MQSWSNLWRHTSECNPVDAILWMKTHGCDFVDEPNVQKEDPFAISDGPITKSMSNKLIEKIVGLIQNLESEEEILGQATTSSTTFIYSFVSYNN